MKAAPMVIIEHVFIERLFFLTFSPNWAPSVSKEAVRVQQKISMARIYFF